MSLRLLDAHSVVCFGYKVTVPKGDSFKGVFLCAVIFAAVYASLSQ